VLCKNCVVCAKIAWFVSSVSYCQDRKTHGFRTRPNARNHAENRHADKKPRGYLQARYCQWVFKNCTQNLHVRNSGQARTPKRKQTGTHTRKTHTKAGTRAPIPPGHSRAFANNNRHITPQNNHKKHFKRLIK